jgi:integral membrane sensor domain MASE1
MMEWEDMDWVDKLSEIALFSLGCLIVAPLLGALVTALICMGIEQITGWGDSDTATSWTIVGAVALFCLSVYGTFKTVRDSKKRSLAKSNKVRLF